MDIGQLNRVIRRVRSPGSVDAAPPLTDGILLERFVQDQDESAFEELMRRHGPMVLGVCRRVLGAVQTHDVEDAFQTTFLVLVKKAATVRPREMVGNWLYGVASLTAMKARALAARRIVKERNAMPRSSAPTDAVWQDVQPVLDEELLRLPDKYRAALVFCDLEGQPRKEAAARLRVPEGTLSSRLTTARNMLAKRLARRGITLSAAGLAVLISQNLTAASVPTAFAASTMKAVSAMAMGNTGAAAGAISANVAALTKGVLGAMFIAKLKVAMILILGLGMVVGGVSMGLGWQSNGEQVAAEGDQVQPHSQKEKQTGGIPSVPSKTGMDLPNQDDPNRNEKKASAKGGGPFTAEVKKPNPLAEEMPRKNVAELIKPEKKLTKNKDRLKKGNESTSVEGRGISIRDGVITVNGATLDRSEVEVVTDATGTRVTVRPRPDSSLPLPVPAMPEKLEPRPE
jgi:RNA polymerase sigma factor (sigma-70 family)